MNKVKNIILVVLLSISVFLLGFNYRQIHEPSTLYKVYLDDKVIGVINSEQELYDKIGKSGDHFKEKYNVDKVYEPNGLEVKRINTFNGNVVDVDEVYKQIENKRPFTVMGYQFTLRGEEETKRIFVTEEEIFEEAMIDTIKTFIGSENYYNYYNNEQEPIRDTGKLIETVYVEENISVRKMKIPVEEKIYTDSQELAQLFLFGEEYTQETYTVKDGDTIESVAFDNEISIEEFMITNPTIQSARNLLYPGQEVLIAKTDPQVRVVVLEHIVEDLESDYSTEYVVDPNLYENQRRLEREGQKGIIRVSQKVTSVNGTITIVDDPDSKEEIVAPVNEIIRIGERRVPTRVAHGDWVWPTNPGWRLTSNYGYRIHPIRGTREFHNGIDIAGTGLGSNIYAANNGVVVNAGFYSSYGLTVVVNHNNGYYTLYSHLNSINVRVGDTVQKRQVVGFMGRTGVATGVHLHFSVFRGAPFNGGGGQPVNPWNFYR